MTIMVFQAVCCVIKEINRSACVIWLGFADTAGLGSIHKLQTQLISLCKSASKTLQMFTDKRQTN